MKSLSLKLILGFLEKFSLNIFTLSLSFYNISIIIYQLNSQSLDEINNNNNNQQNKTNKGVNKCFAFST